MIRFSRFSARPLLSTGTPEQLNLFRDMTGERLSPPAGELDVVGAAEYIINLKKVDRLQVIGKALRPLLLALVILALVMAAIRAVHAAWQRRWTYALTLAAAAAVAVATSLLTVASPGPSIAAFAPLYPLTLVFVVAVFWDAAAAWQERHGGASARPDSSGNVSGSVSV